MINIKIAIFLFSFYLLVFCNATYEILGCKLKQALKSNIYIKHLIAFILLTFLIVLTNEDYANKNIYQIILLGILIYIWFIITTRTNIYIVIIILILLLLIYYFDIKIKYESNETQKERYRYIQKILFGISIIITIIGFIQYTIKTYNEKKNNFDINKYIFGVINCDDDV
jgi:hypothetical protein